MSKNLIVIGISGVTCGGKTTLANKLQKSLPSTLLTSQDTYFFNDDDPRHTWIPELNHVNYDIVASLDMAKMYEDITDITEKYNTHFFFKQNTNLGSFSKDKLLSSIVKKLNETNTKVLILEDKDECYKRRIQRVYDPPDCPGYFEKCAWPEYLNLIKYVKENVSDVQYFDSNVNPLKTVLKDILSILSDI